MKNRRNYYRLLQVQPDAPVEVIRSSFRALMRDAGHHPDLGGSHQDAVLLNEAYETLIDPQRRAEYDRNLYNQYIRRSSSNTPSPSLSTSRRSFGRTKRDERIFCTTNSSQKWEAQMIDFSPEGMLLLCDEYLPKESVMKISSSLLDAAACVTHCSEQVAGGKRLYIVGVTFIAVRFEAAKGALLSATV